MSSARGVMSCGRWGFSVYCYSPFIMQIRLCWGSARFKGFDISRGIRQGCPLSPLLFAMATDLMLRRLQRHFPTSCARAWADDLAMILPTAEEHLHNLQCFFQDFGSMSGLHLNIGKTMIVPLFRYKEEVIRASTVLLPPTGGGWAYRDRRNTSASM